jgi:hypothetical protein
MHGIKKKEIKWCADLLQTRRQDLFIIPHGGSMPPSNSKYVCQAGLPDGIFSNQKSQFG